jgi:hypothetical protein
MAWYLVKYRDNFTFLLLYMKIVPVYCFTHMKCSVRRKSLVRYVSSSSLWER